MLKNTEEDERGTYRCTIASVGSLLCTHWWMIPRMPCRRRRSGRCRRSCRRWIPRNLCRAPPRSFPSATNELEESGNLHIPGMRRKRVAHQERYGSQPELPLEFDWTPLFFPSRRLPTGWEIHRSWSSAPASGAPQRKKRGREREPKPWSCRRSWPWPWSMEDSYTKDSEWSRRSRVYITTRRTGMGGQSNLEGDPNDWKWTKKGSGI